MDTLTLSELAVRAAREGEARDEFLTRVRGLALRYARVRLGRFGAEDTAQDVAQEVCMAVLTALPTYEDRGGPFEAFLYRVTANKVADAQRAALRGPVAVEEVPDRPDETAGPEDLALIGDESARALHLMQKLPETQREILILRVALGLSTEETAAALGMTPGAIRVAQHRALARLRVLIDTGRREGAA